MTRNNGDSDETFTCGLAWIDIRHAETLRRDSLVVVVGDLPVLGRARYLGTVFVPWIFTRGARSDYQAMKLVELGWTRIPVNKITAVRIINRPRIVQNMQRSTLYIIEIFVEHRDMPFDYTTEHEPVAQKVYTDALAALEAFHPPSN